MDIIVSSRNVEVSPSLRPLAVEKIGRLDRYLEGMDRAEVPSRRSATPASSSARSARS